MLLPVLPTTAHEVAKDTFLVPTFAAMPTGGFFGAHSLVVRGREPMIVDTGSALVRDAWLEQAFSVVEPEDVRWIFLSHDDHDHIGNLDVVLARCPNATVIANFGIVGRLALDADLPLERMRWLDPGAALDLGDRVITLVRPPSFDSPATRGFHDSATNLLYAVDAFGALVQGEVYDASDVAPDLYDMSFTMLNSWNTPWLEWVDVARFTAHVEVCRALNADVVVTAHGPVHRGSEIDSAYARTLALAGQTPAPQPGQDMLDQLVATALGAGMIGGPTMWTLKHSGRVETVCDATPEAVWALASDPTRIGEWSHECLQAELVDADAVAPGVRFRGSNKVGRVGWARTNEIVRVDAPRTFAWRTVPTRMYPDSTEWTISIEPAADGTRIVQTFEVLKLNPVMERLIWLVTPADRDRMPALREDLERLGKVAAGAS